MGLAMGNETKIPKISFDSKGFNNVDKYHFGYGNKLLTATEHFTKYPNFESLCFKIERVDDIHNTLERLVRELRKTSMIFSPMIDDEIQKAETLLLEIKNAKF